VLKEGRVAGRRQSIVGHQWLRAKRLYGWRRALLLAIAVVEVLLVVEAVAALLVL
jgi:hypothetical protein